MRGGTRLPHSGTGSVLVGSGPNLGVRERYPAEQAGVDIQVREGGSNTMRPQHGLLDRRRAPGPPTAEMDDVGVLDIVSIQLLEVGLNVPEAVVEP